MNVVACLCERLRWCLVFDAPIRHAWALAEAHTWAAGACNWPARLSKSPKKGLDISFAVV